MGSVSPAVTALPLADRVALLSGADVWHTGELPGGRGRLTLADGPHGLRVPSVGGDHFGATGSLPATCFPTASALASSWDPGLLESVGRAIGIEARHAGVDLVLGPGLNIKRHPLGGRNFEYFSEDPLLSGAMAAAMVRGIQSCGVGACLKHFAVNSCETLRLVVDAVIDERTLREIYLSGFEIAVKAAGPAAVMAAYNRVNGTFCCSHHHLLAEVLRDEWGFRGFVVSDWGATDNRVAALAAGTDLEMPGNRGASDADVIEAVAAGELPEDAVSTSVQRLVDFADRPVGPIPELDLAGHHDLARRSAADSMVLLSNDGLLPLTGDDLCVAVIGAFAVQPRFQGSGSSLVNPTQVDTFLAALSQREGAVYRYAPGYDPGNSAPNPAMIDRAVAVAGACDVAVVMVGLPAAFESEGFDRRHMRMPRQHNLLVEAVSRANARTAVVLCNGAPVSVPWAHLPAACLASHLAGQAAGSALVDVLFGDREPGGRLAETYPMQATDVASAPWFPQRSRQAQHREGVFIGYRYFDTADLPVRYPFGHGLSYTTFDYADAAVEPPPPDVADLSLPAEPGGSVVAEVVVRVTNSGQRAGSEVVQVYVHPPDDDSRAPVRPDQELRAFRKIHLEAGQSTVVRMTLGSRAFATYDASRSRWVTPPGRYELRIGSSSRDIRSVVELDLDDPSADAGLHPRTKSPGRAVDALDTHASNRAADGNGGDTEIVASGEDQFAARLGRPVPAPPAVLPFHRNSVIGDLAATRTGRLVRRGLRRVLGPSLGDIAAGDAAALDRLYEAADEAPLRQLVLLGDGRVTWEALDALIAWLNGGRIGPARTLVVSLIRRGGRTRLPRPPGL